MIQYYDACGRYNPRNIKPNLTFEERKNINKNLSYHYEVKTKYPFWVKNHFVGG